MTEARASIGKMGGRIALALIAAALLMRLLVPAGWMPSTDGGYAITLCTGAGVTKAWVDGEGRVHKEQPGKATAEPHCIFAAFGAALDRPSPIGTLAAPYFAFELMTPTARHAIAIGRGLAAPPPPATGPPASL